MKLDPAGDRALVRRMLAGQEAAFEEFFAAYFPALFRFASVRLRDAVAAEEVVQAVLCRALTKLSSYRGEAALFTWLCTFCRNEISAYCNARGRTVRVDLAEDLPEVRAALESWAAHNPDDPESALRRREVATAVQTTLDRLPHRYGDALEWKYIDGLTVAEIGQRLGLGPKAAESLLARAREAFRDGFLSLARERRPAEAK
ncbi:MAG TPA: sigma-70 family RNA polymerase sigma factor [Vicinamibacteria bacterium]|nr:sigma-70 family RNA polymerase sigma factor [Vicinamibacteria bacterium]